MLGLQLCRPDRIPRPPTSQAPTRTTATTNLLPGDDARARRLRPVIRWRIVVALGALVSPPGDSARADGTTERPSAIPRNRPFGRPNDPLSRPTLHATGVHAAVQRHPPVPEGVPTAAWAIPPGAVLVPRQMCRACLSYGPDQRCRDLGVPGRPLVLRRFCPHLTSGARSNHALRRGRRLARPPLGPLPHGSLRQNAVEDCEAER